jgi:hypothetical protein
VLRVKVADPPVRVPTPRLVTPSKNVTTPGGVPLELVTVAVSETGLPANAGFGEALRTVLVWAGPEPADAVGAKPRYPQPARPTTLHSRTIDNAMRMAELEKTKPGSPAIMAAARVWMDGSKRQRSGCSDLRFGK